MSNIPKSIKGTKPLKKKGHIDISDESLHRLEESTESLEYMARFSDVTHESSLFPSSSPAQYPTIQVMERGFDPSRIPTSIFNGPPTPGDWSVASNDSLFSIRIGNSFRKDHGFRTSVEVQKPEELRKSTVGPEEAYRFIETDKSRDLCQSDGVRRSVELISSKQNNKRVDPAIGGTHNHNTKNLQVNFIDTPKVSVFANKPEKSEHVIQISDFPVKKSSCPMCHCCHELYCCETPSCSCKWLSCKWLSCLTKCFSWPSCSTNCFSCKGCRCKFPSCCCTCPSSCFKCPPWPSCNFKYLTRSSCCCKCPSWPSCKWTCCSCWKSKSKISRYHEVQRTTQPNNQASSERCYGCFSCSAYQASSERCYGCFSCSAYRSCCSCYASSCCSC